MFSLFKIKFIYFDKPDVKYIVAKDMESAIKCFCNSIDADPLSCEEITECSDNVIIAEK